MEEYENGHYKRTYARDAINVQASGGVVAVSISRGKVEEYEMDIIREFIR
ncbi:IceA2 protein [Helicobacter cetorum]|nr:IceA2 protein [Helicobacter cetorum]